MKKVIIEADIDPTAKKDLVQLFNKFQNSGLDLEKFEPMVNAHLETAGYNPENFKTNISVAINSIRVKIKRRLKVVRWK